MGTWLFLFGCLGMIGFAITALIAKKDRKKWKWAIGICFVVAAIGFVTADTSPNKDQAQQSAVQQAAPSEPSPAQQPTAQEPVPVQQAADPVEQSDLNQELTDAVKKYVLEGFGGNGNLKYQTSWYSAIKDIEIHTFEDINAAYIKTSLYPKEENKSVAQTIANSVLFYRDARIARVEVYDKDGLLFYWRYNSKN